MSLKQFHIGFIALASLVSGLLGVWGLGHFQHDAAAGALGATGTVLGVTLVGYLIWFINKARLWN